jgi:MFS family permease
MTNKLGSAPISSLLVSASSSLPLHVMPLLIAAAYHQKLLTTTQAGWMATSLALGQIIATLILGWLNLVPRSKLSLTLVFFLIFVGLALATQTSTHWVFVGWLAIGVGCGCLQQYGIVISADSANASASLATRLAFVLMLSGLVVAGSQLMTNQYLDYLTALGIGFFIIAGGIVLSTNKKPEQRIKPVGKSATSPLRGYAYLGLAVALGFFIGQPGFWQYAAHYARESGINLQGLAFAIAAAKCVSAVALWLIYRSKLSVKIGFQVLCISGSICALSMLSMRLSQQAIQFFIAMLIWEISLNTISPKLQALTLEIDPAFCKRWLGLMILLGMAAGPAIHGFLLGHGQGSVFMAYALVSSFFGAAIFLLHDHKIKPLLETT